MIRCLLRWLAARRTRSYFRARAARADPEAFKRILATAGTLPPRERDVIKGREAIAEGDVHDMDDVLGEIEEIVRGNDPTGE